MIMVGVLYQPGLNLWCNICLVCNKGVWGRRANAFIKHPFSKLQYVIIPLSILTFSKSPLCKKQKQKKEDTKTYWQAKLSDCRDCYSEGGQYSSIFQCRITSLSRALLLQPAHMPSHHRNKEDAEQRVEGSWAPGSTDLIGAGGLWLIRSHRHLPVW